MKPRPLGFGLTDCEDCRRRDDTIEDLGFIIGGLVVLLVVGLVAIVVLASRA